MEIKEAVIVGTGYSGICMAIKLQQAGITNFVMLEKEKELGGTWYINKYPGAACDVESHLYSFSFEPYDWSRTFPQQEELDVYIKHCADKYQLKPYMKLGTAITAAIFNEQENVWEITTDKNEKIKAKILISGMGALNDPAYPDIKGTGEFEGVTFHSSIWNHKFDMKGKNVAVIGSGASAIQFVPEIAQEVKNLFLFQRTPNWILPKHDRPFKAWERKLFKTIPMVRKLYRERLYWEKELRVVAFVKFPNIFNQVAKTTIRFLRKYIKDPELQKAMIPNYTMGCKRILLSNNYYPAIIRENVKVITDGVAQINKNSITTKTGKEVPVDAIIYATGFKATDPLSNVHIVGNGGKVLNDVWKADGGEAYLGTTVAGFPNLFIMTGPNTGVGHTSMIHIIESQARYIMDCLKYVNNKKLKSFTVKEDVQKEFNVELQKKMKGTVWQSGGCKSWYQDANGRNTTLWPGFTVQFRKMTKHFDPKNYQFNLK